MEAARVANVPLQTVNTTESRRQQKNTSLMQQQVHIQQQGSSLHVLASLSMLDLVTTLVASYVQSHMGGSKNNSDLISARKLSQKLLVSWKRKQLESGDHGNDNIPLSELQRQLTESCLVTGSSGESALKIQKVLHALRWFDRQGKREVGESSPIETVVNVLVRLKDQLPRQYSNELKDRMPNGNDEYPVFKKFSSPMRSRGSESGAPPTRSSMTNEYTSSMLDGRQRLPNLQSSNLRRNLEMASSDDPFHKKSGPPHSRELTTAGSDMDPSPSVDPTHDEYDQYRAVLESASDESSAEVLSSADDNDPRCYPLEAERYRFDTKDNRNSTKESTLLNETQLSPYLKGSQQGHSQNIRHGKKSDMCGDEATESPVSVRQKAAAMPLEPKRYKRHSKIVDPHMLKRVDHECYNTQKTCSAITMMTPSELSDRLYYRGLPQFVLCRDLLYPLQGIDGMYIKYHEPTDSFLIRRDVNVSEPIRVLVSRLCTIGIYYRRIRRHLDAHLLPTASSKRVPFQQVNEWWDEGVSITLMPSSATLEQGSHPPVPTVQSPGSSGADSPKASETVPHRVQPLLPNASLTYPTVITKPTQPVRSLIYDSFSQFLRDQLTEYYKLLAVIETELSAAPDCKDPGTASSPVYPFVGSTLRRLTVWLQDPLQRMATLAAVADSVIGLKGGPLLSMIFDFSRRGDPALCVLLNNMLNVVGALWYEMVSRWIRDGELFDPFDEFCILQNPRCWNFKSDPIWISRPRNKTALSTMTPSDKSRYPSDHSRYRKERCEQLHDASNHTYGDSARDDNECLNGTMPEFLWKFGFAVDSDRVPVFVSQSIAQKILTSGKAVAMIKLFRLLESTQLNPAAVSMKSSASAETSSIVGTYVGNFRQSNTPTAETKWAVAPHPAPYKQKQGVHQVASDDTWSECGMKSDVISVVNGGSPTKKRSHSISRPRGELTINRGESPCSQMAYVESKCVKKILQPKHLQLLEGLSSVIGMKNDLLLGIFNPICDSDIYPHNHQWRDSDENLDYTTGKARYEHSKPSRDGSSLNYSEKNGTNHTLHDLCTGHAKTATLPVPGDLRMTNKEEAIPLKNIKDLENHVRQMEMRHCRRVVDLLLYRYHLLCHCEGIRRLLLLGQGDFVEALLYQFSPTQEPMQNTTLAFDSPGCDLNQKSSSILQYHLRSSLQTAISASNVQLFPEEILQRLDIQKLKCEKKKENQDLIGWEVVTLMYITDGSPLGLVLNDASIQSYSKLHTLLWRLQRVSASMNRIWCDHIRTTRRRLLPMSEQIQVSGASIILQELDYQSQQTVQQCETVHHEMTHFLRNVYSYLSTEVIETCWVEFLHRVAALCGLTPSFVDRGQRHNDTYLELDRLSDDNGWSADGSSSMVDRLIRIHEDYVQSMLHGAFLDSRKEDGGVYSSLDILSDRISILDPKEVIHQGDNNNHMNRAAHAHSSSPMVLETLLMLLKVIMEFVELTELIYSSIYTKQKQQMQGGCKGAAEAISSSLVDRLEQLSMYYTEVMVSFLKQLNQIVKTVNYASDDSQNSCQLGAVVSRYSSSRRSDAIRALLSRLDFSGYYGSDWELYRTTISLNAHKRQIMATPSFCSLQCGHNTVLREVKLEDMNANRRTRYGGESSNIINFTDRGRGHSNNIDSNDTDSNHESETSYRNGEEDSDEVDKN